MRAGWAAAGIVGDSKYCDGLGRFSVVTAAGKRLQKAIALGLGGQCSSDKAKTVRERQAAKQLPLKTGPEIIASQCPTSRTTDGASGNPVPALELFSRIHREASREDAGA